MADRLTIDRKATYRIQIQGLLSSSWADYLGGLEIEVTSERAWPVTTLTGFVQDQAALLGVLNGLYDLGYPLLSVECQYSNQKETKK
jgi:hypothetical protein